MGWGCHPDTMAIASAQHAAKQEVGETADSLTYAKAYRNNYENQNKNNPGISGLDSYLAELDQNIAWKEEGKTDEEIQQIQAERFHRTLMKNRGVPDKEIEEFLDEKFPSRIKVKENFHPIT